MPLQSTLWHYTCNNPLRQQHWLAFLLDGHGRLLLYAITQLLCWRLSHYRASPLLSRPVSFGWTPSAHSEGQMCPVHGPTLWGASRRPLDQSRNNFVPLRVLGRNLKRTRLSVKPDRWGRQQDLSHAGGFSVVCLKHICSSVGSPLINALAITLSLPQETPAPTRSRGKTAKHQQYEAEGLDFKEKQIGEELRSDHLFPNFSCNCLVVCTSCALYD